jgi:hypothetical protein
MSDTENTQTNTPTQEEQKTTEPAPKKQDKYKEYRKQYYIKNKERILADNCARKAYKYHNNEDFRKRCIAQSTAHNNKKSVEKGNEELSKRKEIRNEIKKEVDERYVIKERQTKEMLELKERQNEEIKELKERHLKELSNNDDKIKLLKLNLKTQEEADEN